MSFISSFDIISVVVPDLEAPAPRIFLWIPASTDVNSYGIKTLLANCASTFFISIPRNPPLCSLNNKPESSRHFTIFLMSFISSFDVTSIVVPDPEAPDPITFLWIPVSAAVNSNGIRTLLVNCVSTFFINGKPTFSNDPRKLPQKPPHECCSLLFHPLEENVLK